MVLRFRRTMKIAPGVRLNLNKTGVSTRIGPKGVGITFGTSGTTASAGIPGTGLHVSQKIKKGSFQPGKNKTEPAALSEATGLGAFGWLTVLGCVLGVLWLIL
jgi:hypothetical protein